MSAGVLETLHSYYLCCLHSQKQFISLIDFFQKSRQTLETQTASKVIVRQEIAADLSLACMQKSRPN
jgi:hypothetical protein